jgi:hypothetical protein
MNASYTLRPRARRDLMEQKVAQRYFKAVDQTCARLACISHGTLRVALWRRLFSRPRRLSSRRMEREPLQQHVSARVPRRQPKRLRHEQLAQCRLKGDEKSRLIPQKAQFCDRN